MHLIKREVGVERGCRYQNDVAFTLWPPALGGTERNYAEFEY